MHRVRKQTIFLGAKLGVSYSVSRFTESHVASQKKTAQNELALNICRKLFRQRGKSRAQMFRVIVPCVLLNIAEMCGDAGLRLRATRQPCEDLRNAAKRFNRCEIRGSPQTDVHA